MKTYSNKELALKFKSNNEIVYVVLCNIKFNREILNSINLYILKITLDK